MTARDDLDRQLDAYLMDGPTELPEASFFAIRDRTESARQRAVLGPWRTFDIMNKLVPIGLGAAAVVVALVIGIQLLGPTAPSGVGVPASASPSPTPDPSPTSEPSSAWTGLPAGPFAVTGPDDPVQVTVEIASPSWLHEPDLDFLSKDDDGLDAPQTVGGALLAWSWPAGTGFDVYGHPCQWSTTIPETAATTPAEIAAAFQKQAETEATAPVDVTIGGFTGTSLTLTVPLSYEVPGASREEEFAACDQSTYGFYAAETDTEPARNAQGPGQIDELWIIDVDGAILFLDATYGPATPPELVDEMRAMAESATFE